MSEQSGPSTDDIDKRVWHTLSHEDTLHILDTSEHGLSGAEAETRQRSFGPNKLPEGRRAGALRIFIKQFKSALIYILLIAAVISLVIGELNDALFIFTVLIINAVVGAIQEYKAETSAAALRQIMHITARVLRDGRRRAIDSIELVPGDIVLLEAGDAVPADIRLLSGKELRVDESLLTGESLPVDKNADALLAEHDAPLGERLNMLHAGTHVVDGRATGVVCRTGIQTEVGHIASSLEESATPPPLVLRLERFTYTIAIVTVVFIALLAAGQLLRGADLIEIFFLAIALAVSAIPEGLPVAITVALAIASHRMSLRSVIVRLLPAVEGLGTCTMIASDKTGTLTANTLTAKRLHLADGYEVDIGGEGVEPDGELTHERQPLDADHTSHTQRLAVSAALCNEAEYWSENGSVHQSGDTVDVAFLVFAAKLGLEQQRLNETCPPVNSIPFQSSRRYAASFNRHDDKTLVHVKGAAESVLPMCSDIDERLTDRLHHELTRDGYRVLAVARGEVDPAQAQRADENALQGLTFLGFMGLIDPIREEVPEALRKCHGAGIQVAMITGDHPATGLAIARQLGIAADEQQVVTGSDIKEWDKDEQRMMDNIKHARVFARVEPAHKTRIVQAFQNAGHFVAVTGDGVNDAPALRTANIGVAMGRSGTDVARKAADLILTDDNFASIVNGVEEGRVAYDNVRKVTWLLISTGAAEILLFFLAFVTGLPLPLDAVQLLWLNLVTNGIQDVALAFERNEPGVLKRPPRPPGQPIFDRLMIQETVVSGAFMGGVAFAVFYWLMSHPGWSEFEARNVLLLLMVLFENIHAFNCRSESRSVFHIPLRANPLLILTVIAAQGIHILAMYIPGLSSVLEIQPVAVETWSILLLIATTLLATMEVFKRYTRGRNRE